MIRLTLATRHRNQFLDITDQVAQAVVESGVNAGLCLVFVPHTTAGITIQENADPDVVRDMLLWFENLVPKDYRGFRHAEGNSDSHIKASLMGSSVAVIIENGRLVLGTWQGIYFCEFDGPRTRGVNIRIQGH